VTDTTTEVANLRAERLALRQAVAFFASVIKSGEPWTETCERTLRAVLDGPKPEADNHG
jgi:hypothetical protein